MPLAHSNHCEYAMAASKPVVKCNACGQELQESASTEIKDRVPCPNCGGLARAFEIRLTSTLTMRSKLSSKARSLGRKKPFLEQVSGDDLYRLTGQWNKLKRIIDRARDYYLEIVTDPKTGKVIRYCEEPLSDHHGRGSAKVKKEKGGA